MSGVPASWVSRIIGVSVEPKNFNVGNAQMLPQQLVVIGQGNDGVSYSLDKYECEGSAAEIGEPTDSSSGSMGSKYISPHSPTARM